MLFTHTDLNNCYSYTHLFHSIQSAITPTRFHDISSDYISSIRRLVECDISSIRRLVAYDIWSNTFRLNFVGLRRTGLNLAEKAKTMIFRKLDTLFPYFVSERYPSVQVRYRV